MEPLTLKPRQPVEDAIENWDDDEDLQGFDDLNFRNVSSTTTGSMQPHHRESTSSRMSMRSDRESNGGAEEDWQVLLPTDDEKSTATAISQAKNAGIPIPQNVPASALVGGTIKRMGGRRLKKALGDDWGDDLELPNNQDGGLVLRRNDGKEFDDALRHFSVEFPSSPSPAQPHQDTNAVAPAIISSSSKPNAAKSALEKFKDCEDDMDFGDVPTIKIAKQRSPQKPVNFTPPPARVAPDPMKDNDNMEDDLEFPDDDQPLRLSTNKDLPKTPASQLEDTFDTDWADGSLGTRFGGTRRDIRSNPSSSVSAFSPSASSRLTGNESEDDGLDDLILPAGPFKFEDALKKRLENVSPGPMEHDVPKQVSRETKSDEKSAREDFLSGIDIGDGEVFESGKLTLNRNIKHKTTRQSSPQRRAAMTLTFTNKSEHGASKIPRPQSHDRPRPTLEPVSESGGPVPQYRRPGSRMMGHSAQSSLSAIPTPPTPLSSAVPPATPTRRGLNPSSSRDALKPNSTAAAPPYLKNKRSMPLMTRNAPSPARPQASYQRAPSRGGDYSTRNQPLPSRPKTPIDRSGAESSLANARKQSIPFLPAGISSNAQSHHVNVKSSRYANRPNSSDSNENMPINRPISRLSNMHRPSTPTSRRDHAPDFLAREAASKRTLTKPTRRRAFGDGNELEIFDDLPTSATSESKFTKAPIARGAPKSVQMRSKLGTQHANSSTTSLQDQPALPQTPSRQTSPTRRENVPRFARDTNASRVAREQRIGSVSAALHAQPSLPTVRETGGPLSSISTNWTTGNPRPSLAQQLHSGPKQLASPMHPKSRTKVHSRAPPQKPRLIKPMNEAAVNSAKTLKGMSWNPTLFRWEGNENALTGFDAPLPGPGLASPKSPKTISKAAPALIANVGPSTKGVQMSGGMVFDPARMCWLKMAPSGARRGPGGANTMSPDALEEDDDPFAGLDDLEEGPTKPVSRGGGMDESFGSGSFGGGKKMLEEEEDAVIQEEFDVGPEFIRRQRVEEDRWRSKVAGWVGQGIGREDEGRGGWKWAIRDKAMMLG